MKSAGLSSTYKKMLRKTTKSLAYATTHVGHLAALEKKKAMRLQAERAQIDRQKREALLSTIVAASSDDSSSK